MGLQNGKNKDSDCPCAEIAEYLDGELSASDEMRLELHLAGCGCCRDELNRQKKVSVTLELLLDERHEEIELPENFTRVVTARAESDLDGLRSPKERSRGLFIFGILFVLLLFGLGTEGETVVLAVEQFAEQMLAVGGFVFRLVYTLTFGLSAILSAVCHKMVVGSGPVLLLAGIGFVVSFVLLSRMILRFGRS